MQDTKKTVANQTLICNGYETKESFVKTGMDAFIAYNTLKNISAEAFVLWQEIRLLYFKTEELHHNENMALSPANIADKLYGGSNDVVVRSIQKLIKKLKDGGWLINIKSNLWCAVVPTTPSLKDAPSPNDGGVRLQMTGYPVSKRRTTPSPNDGESRYIDNIDSIDSMTAAKENTIEDNNIINDLFGSLSETKDGEGRINKEEFGLGYNRYDNCTMQQLEELDGVVPDMPF